MASSQECYILQMPDEMLLDIIANLKTSDLDALAETCSKFRDVCQSIRPINFEQNSSQTVAMAQSAVARLADFFSSKINPLHIHVINLNGCYWVKDSVIEHFLVRCKNVQQVDLLETQINCHQIINILQNCHKICTLSFTLKPMGENGWKKYRDTELTCLEQLQSLEIFAESACAFDDFLFLEKCRNLETLVIPRCSLWNWGHLGGSFLFYLQQLKTFILLGWPINWTRVHGLLVCESSQLTTSWSNVSNSLYGQNPFKSVSWKFQKDGAGIPNLSLDSRLTSVTSFQEPAPLLMRDSILFTQLQLVNCFYDGMHFAKFSANHRLIQTLKLRHVRPNPNGLNADTDQATPAAWSVESWREMPDLRALSLDAQLIEFKPRPKKRKMKEGAAEKDEERCTLSYVAIIATSCPLIQELEIIGREKPQTRYGIKIDVKELKAITALSATLKRLVLCGIDVKDGHFIFEILESCKNLESLRIRDIGSRDYCCFSSDLIKALPLALKLKTFCMIQNKVSQPHIIQLLEALSSCPNLTRIGFIVPSTTLKLSKQDLANRFSRLCVDLKGLVALFGVLNTTLDYLEHLQNILCERFTTQRPMLCIEFQMPDGVDDDVGYDTIHAYDSTLPMMHSDLICNVKGHVAILPDDCKSFIQRIY